MSLEKNVGTFVRNKGINLSAMSRATGIPYAALYNSLIDEKRKREMKGNELILICKFLEVNPMDFADDAKTDICKKQKRIPKEATQK